MTGLIYTGFSDFQQAKKSPPEWEGLKSSLPVF